MILKNMFCLIFLLTFLNIETIRAGGKLPTNEPPICQPPPYWSKDGKDLMHEHLGNVTLVALMELQCTFCRNQISSLERLLDYVKNHSLEPTKIIIIAPMNESSVFVEYHQQTLHGKGIIVIQESRQEPIWEPLKGFNNDFFLYDRCGRLNFHIPYPQSFTYYHYTVNTIYSVHKHQKCGPCNVYPPRRTDYPSQFTFDPSLLTPKQVKAWVETQPPGNHQGTEISSRPIDTQRSVETQTSLPTEVLVETHTYEPAEIESTSRNAHKKDNQTEKPKGHKIRHDKHKKGKGKKKGKLSTTEVPTTTVLMTTEFADGNEDSVIYDPDDSEVFTTTTEPEFDMLTAQLVPTQSVTQSGLKNHTNDGVHDHDNDNDDEEIKTVPSKKLGSAIEVALTTSTSRSTTTSTTRKPYTGTRQPKSTSTRRPRIKKPIEDAGGCSSFSDISCFDLQENNKELDPCCYKGVYLTGVCNRDLCTSRTYHLCCFQKYQQARYQCCYNDTMMFDRPDDFSKCCYNIFVEDDPCCPTSVAHGFWSHKTRITELCLPSIDVDYTGVVLEAEMKDKSKVKLDLGKFKSQLQYQCPAASKRNDFFYWEPDAPPKTEVVDVITD